MSNEKKYTAKQWSEIEGGHEMSADKSKYQLINTLTESRLFRNKKIASALNVDDAANLVFVYLMALNVFNKDYDFAPLASEYSQRTVAFNNFNSFRTSGTDLYIALNRLVGKDQEYTSASDEIAIERVRLNILDMKRILNHFATNNIDTSKESALFLRFQKQLNIQDSMLISLRRLVVDWDNLNQNQRALVVTRMMQYLRQKAPRGELTLPMKEFQKRGDFKVDDSKDTKKNRWKGALAIGAGVAAAAILPKLGKEAGKTSYTKGGTYQRNRFPK